jgi:putative DNA-invertase from lambdoid prophage Rac
LFGKLRKGDGVISPKLDRLFRSELDALTVVENLPKLGVSVHLPDLGGDISGNRLGKLFMTVPAAFAEAERDRIRRASWVVKVDQRAHGRYLGRNCSLWLSARRKRGVPEPQAAEREAIKENGRASGAGEGAEDERRRRAGTANDQP